MGKYQQTKVIIGVLGLCILKKMLDLVRDVIAFISFPSSLQ